MSTPVVDKSYRAGLGNASRGLGRRLLEPVLAHKDVVVTGLTPNVMSLKSCESMGFKRLDSELVVIPVFGLPVESTGLRNGSSTHRHPARTSPCRRPLAASASG